MYAVIAVALAAIQTAAPAPSNAAAEPLQPASAPAEASSPCCTLPKLTPVTLTVGEAVESDKVKIGQTFAIRLARPLVLAEGVIVTAGTPGVGEVVHAAKSRAMGKPGELVLAARYLNWNGTRIPLRSFRFGKPQGQDNADTAAIVGIAVSAVIAPFITGGEVRIPAGADAWAKTADDVRLTPSISAAPSVAAISSPQGE